LKKLSRSREIVLKFFVILAIAALTTVLRDRRRFFSLQASEAHEELVNEPRKTFALVGS
jgi:hypothetical protein